MMFRQLVYGFIVLCVVLTSSLQSQAVAYGDISHSCDHTNQSPASIASPHYHQDEPHLTSANPPMSVHDDLHDCCSEMMSTNLSVCDECTCPTQLCSMQFTPFLVDTFSLWEMASSEKFSFGSSSTTASLRVLFKPPILA